MEEGFDFFFVTQQRTRKLLTVLWDVEALLNMARPHETVYSLPLRLV